MPAAVAATDPLADTGIFDGSQSVGMGNLFGGNGNIQHADHHAKDNQQAQDIHNLFVARIFFSVHEKFLIKNCSQTESDACHRIDFCL